MDLREDKGCKINRTSPRVDRRGQVLFQCENESAGAHAGQLQPATFPSTPDAENVARALSSGANLGLISEGKVIPNKELKFAELGGMFEREARLAFSQTQEAITTTTIQLAERINGWVSAWRKDGDNAKITFDSPGEPSATFSSMATYNIQTKTVAIAATALSQATISELNALSRNPKFLFAIAFILEHGGEFKKMGDTNDAPLTNLSKDEYVSLVGRLSYLASHWMTKSYDKNKSGVPRQIALAFASLTDQGARRIAGRLKAIE